MLNKLLKKSNDQGFTIIEVMIVLAIAGLIILIVLLAVPALQRNGRNTAIKNDASAIAGGVSEFQSNNDGATPTTFTAANGTVAIAGGAGTTPTNAKTQGGTSVGVVAAVPAAPTAAAPSPAVGTIAVFLSHKCEDATGSLVPGTAGQVNARSTAIYYTIEASGITQQKCIDA